MAAVIPPITPGYAFVLGDVDIPDRINEGDSMRQILHWIEFRTGATWKAMVINAFDSFEDIHMLPIKDIESMTTSFAARTTANGRIVFGTRRTKLLNACVHWIQDSYRISALPTFIGLTDITFKEALTQSWIRDEVRVNLKSQISTTADAASPGPLKNGREWKQWEEKFTNYCASHMEAFGIPLSYVIRTNDAPATDQNSYPDFLHRTVA